MLLESGEGVRVEDLDRLAAQILRDPAHRLQIPLLAGDVVAPVDERMVDVALHAWLSGWRAE